MREGKEMQVKGLSGWLYYPTVRLFLICSFVIRTSFPRNAKHRAADQVIYIGFLRNSFRTSSTESVTSVAYFETPAAPSDIA